MSVIVLPTNVRLPTRFDVLRDRFIGGEIDLETFEVEVGVLLMSGTEDEPGTPLMGGLYPNPPAGFGISEKGS